jgi:ribonuclease D
VNIVINQEELDNSCQKMASQKIIAVDTEFWRGTNYYPKPCVIQMSSSAGNYLIDLIDTNLDLSPICDILINKDILKIFHSAKQDMEIFYNLFRKLPANVFDTQIAATVCGQKNLAGYASLVRAVFGIEIDNVKYLPTIYEHYLEKLRTIEKEAEFAAAIEELLNIHNYAHDPEEAYKRIGFHPKTYLTQKILHEAAKLREEYAQRLNKPRKRVMSDKFIVSLAIIKPSDIKGLYKIKGFARKTYGEDLLRDLLAKMVKIKEEGDYEI